MSVKPGDVYILGRHRLACGRAEDPEQVRRLVGEQGIASIITDPPYGVDYVGGKASFNLGMKHEAIVNDERRTPAEYAAFTAAWLKAALPYLEPKNSLYIFNTDKMLFGLHEGMKEAGCTFGQLLIWLKQQPVMGRLNYLPQHELIVYGWYKRQRFMKSKDRSVIFEPRPRRNVYHPTQKAVPLLRRLILNSTEVGDVVYDPFGGSGSLLLGAEETMRCARVLECEEKYVQTTLERWERLTNLKAVKEACDV